MSQAAKTRKIFDGRYEILSIVGRGACSVVYHARDISSPANPIALKVLLENKSKNPNSERLRREALAMVSCRHKYVARLDDFHSVGSLCYLSMEYCAESDIRAYLRKKGGKLDSIQVERFLKQAIDGIAFVHKAGIVHRDIKPENILVANDKEIRLTDFGVALLPGEQTSIADLQSGIGTMNYMAPEMLEGHSADQRSDIYALGIVFYELFSGVNPFENVPLAEQIESRRDGNIAPIDSIVPGISSHIAAVISKAIRFNPLERYQNADQMLKDLIERKSQSFNIKAKRKASLQHQQLRPYKTSQAETTASAYAEHKSQTASQEAAVMQDMIPDTVALETPAKQFESSAATARDQDDKQADHRDQLAALSEEASSSLAENSATQNTSSYDAPGLMTVNEDSSSTQSSATANANLLALEVAAQAATPTNGVAKEPKASKRDKAMRDSDKNKHFETRDFDHPNQRKTVALSRDTVNKIRSSAAAANTTPSVHNPRPSAAKKPALKLKRDIKTALILACGIILAIVVFVPDFRHKLASLGQIDLSKWTKSAPQSLIPAFSADNFNFPVLPQGTYSGTITNLMPGRAVPLTLISFEKQDKLVVIAGIEGWTPAIISPREIQANATGNVQKPLRIASNGFIIDMTGQNVDGELFGYFKNIVTGIQGEWSAKPLKK